ncbi:MAG: chemotaxis protein CheA [Candidatus Omnitrophota bacterium]|nr:MAG: chemotaxis protein CheA [Candidatus Omnitrophota bacterium]
MEKNYRELFFSESQEYLKEINKALVNLEKNPQDEQSINEIFRHMHTLKGMAATMGYKELAEFAHHLEDAFDNFRAGKSTLTPEIMDIVFESIDAFTTVVEELREEKPISVDIPSYLVRVSSLVSKGERKEYPQVPQEYSIPIDEEYIKKLKEENKELLKGEVTLQDDCLLKGARVFLILKRVRMLGQIVQVIPSEDKLKDGTFGNSFHFFLATKELPEKIEEEVSKVLEVKEIKVSKFTPSAEKAEKKRGKATSYIKKIQSMRIPVERLDKVMNLMGELAIAKSRLTQTVISKDYTALEETTYLIERLVSSLQDEALKMRLLPISYILDNFPRIVRDLSRKEGKEVDLDIVGSEIELDRVVLDEIGDPLIHLIRNAIDHGIETPQERRKVGKPSRGKILIKVSREKGHIIIEISDDGRGIDVDKVVATAAEKGLISPQEVSKNDYRQILDILTTPGFSTSEKVTDVSGRGVGLDVVRNKLDALGGRLDLETQRGKGTKFILTLPLTLAIIKAMLVLVGEQIYAIPLMNIRETVKIREAELKRIKDIEVMRLREEIIPILRLDKELGMKTTVTQEKKEEISIVIVEGRTKSMGLVVDKVIGEQDIVVKPLGSFVKRIKGIAGGTILGDGRVALILDVVNIK